MNSHKTFDYSKYMTIEVLEDGYQVYFMRDVEYNLNGHKWMPLKAGLISPTLKKGDLLSIRCSLTPGVSFGRIFGNGKAINLRGNILSLIFKDDINLDISSYRDVFDNTFSFSSGNNIVSVEKNFLPASTLSEFCYNALFFGCKNLVNGPELPAAILTRYCYSDMFDGCSKLSYIKMLATDISETSCLINWVYGVSSTGTFVKNPAMNSLPTGVSGIPSGWTVINDGEESGGGGNLITFTIDGTEYQAEEGMTWVEWCNSDYNVNNYVYDEWGIYWDNGGPSILMLYYSSGGVVGISDIILPIGTYIFSD